MTLTMTELDAVVTEVSRAIAGGTVRGLAAPEPDLAILTVQSAAGLVRVAFCVRPGLARMHLTRRRLVDPPDAVPAFTGPARREVLGAEVVRVGLRFGDRVAAIDLRTASGDRTLLFECSGLHPNLYVLLPGGRIHAMLALSRSRLRSLRPGARYERPLPHPAGVEADRFLGARGSISAEVEAFYAAEEARLGHAAGRPTVPATRPAIGTPARRLRHAVDVPPSEPRKARPPRAPRAPRPPRKGP